jgi:N6-adenosine-specific RNA methylase IME4
MFSIIYADPCWDYKGQTQHTRTAATGGALEHYPTMKLAALKQLKVQDITAPDALLFLWTSSPHLDQAIELMKAWGFSYTTIAFVWDKKKTNPSYYTLSQVEVCLVGKRGKIPTPRGSRKERQFLSEMRGVHSKKPDEVRDRITRMFPTQRKLEMFARTAADGWSVWGNEVASDVVIATT